MKHRNHKSPDKFKQTMRRKNSKRNKKKKIRKRGRITANTRSASAFTKYNIRELHGNQ